MPDRFQNKYRISSARLQTWDYANEGAYFLTICTKNRICYFGEIEKQKMKLSNMGVIADLMWYEIKNHAKNIELGEFIVMPNHVHGILILNGNGGGNALDNDSNVLINGSTDGLTNGSTNGLTDVETRHALSLPNEPNEPNESNEPNEPNPSPATNPPTTAVKPSTIGANRFQNQGKNTVSAIIGGYKSAVTKHANRLGFEFGWQSRFYDHIIRDAQSFERIQSYIANNPFNWKDDKFYK